MWHEGKLPQSPAPPPPSPEPTRDLITELSSAENYQPVPPSTPVTARENAHLAILKVSTENYQSVPPSTSVTAKENAHLAVLKKSTNTIFNGVIMPQRA